MEHLASSFARGLLITADTFVNQIARDTASSLLEIASISTGTDFSVKLPVRGFTHHSRFVYASEFQKKHNNQFSKFSGLAELALQIKSVKAKFDIAFLDPWHEVEDSLHLIEIAITRLRPGATLVMHDCHPHGAELRSTSVPKIFSQAWCGSTWAGWSLLTQSLSHGFSWMTIDDDYGIGVLKIPETRAQRRRLLRHVRSLSKRWSLGDLPLPDWSSDPSHLHLVAATDPRVDAWV